MAKVRSPSELMHQHALAVNETWMTQAFVDPKPKTSIAISRHDLERMSERELYDYVVERGLGPGDELVYHDRTGYQKRWTFEELSKPFVNRKLPPPVDPRTLYPRPVYTPPPPKRHIYTIAKPGKCEVCGWKTVVSRGEIDVCEFCALHEGKK